jgi:hypothetical protein
MEGGIALVYRMSLWDNSAPPPVGWSHDTIQYITITAGVLR